MKKLLLMVFNIILISIFNVLFRYINVLNDVNSFNSNSSVIGGYLTSSNSDVPYYKIFIFSFVVTTLLFVLIVFILKKCFNSSFLKIVSKLNNMIVFVFVILSILLLYFNTTVSFIFLIIGFVIFTYYIYKEFDCKKYIYLICLILILYFLILYFISF